MNYLDEYVIVIFEGLGMGKPAECYLRDFERLHNAALEWQDQPGAKSLGNPEFKVPNLCDGVIHTGNLDLAEGLGWCKNEAAKAFVRYCDERTGHMATLLMLQLILLIHEVIHEVMQDVNVSVAVNAPGGAGTQ